MAQTSEPVSIWKLQAGSEKGLETGNDRARPVSLMMQ